MSNMRLSKMKFPDDENIYDLIDSNSFVNVNHSDGQYTFIKEDGNTVSVKDNSATRTATSESGSQVLELTDAANAPMVKCVTAITGSQDLHGYDKPWVGGAGSNKWDEEWELGTIDVTNGQNVEVNTNIRSKNYIPVLPNTSYYFLRGNTAGNIIQYDENKDFISTISSPTFFTTSDTTKYVRFYMGSGYGTTYHNDLAVNYPSTVTTYSPYSNICPITAYTEGEIEVRGKNIANISESTKYDRQKSTVTYNSDNVEVTATGTYARCGWIIPTVKNETYTLSFKVLSSGNFNTIYIAYRENTGKFEVPSDQWTSLNIDTFITASSTEESKMITFTANGDHLFVGAYVTSSETTGTMRLSNIQLEKDSTATPYEPYVGTTHTTTFPSAIYRGSEDCVNGSVSEDVILVEPTSANRNASTNYYCDPPAGVTLKGNIPCISNKFRSWNGSESTSTAGICFVNASGKIRFNTVNEYASAAEMLADLGPLQFAAELATPTTSSVAPTNLPIKSLSGYNHIESSTGEMEIEYITESEQAIIDLIDAAVELPKVTDSDNGKILQVSNGEWSAETPEFTTIDDTTTDTDTTWSSSKISSEISSGVQAIIDDTASSTDSTWSSNKISSEISSGDTSIRSNIASTYDPTKTYKVGNIVYQNNTLYRCFVDNTTGTWDATKWRETTVAELIETLSAQPTSWDDVQALVRSGVAPQIFQIGDQLICQKDGVNIVWDVLAHNQDVPTDSTLTRSMTLGMHNIYAMMMFDNKEAAFTTESGLTAGTYNFTVGQHPWVSADVGKTYQFTLTQDVPANGQIVFNNAYNATFNNATVSTYSDGTSTTAIESATMTEGSSGTSLGTINNAGTPASGINSIQRALLGSNNYKESAIRQWLNSDQVAGSVWTPQTKFDRPPDWRNSSKGFMNGLDADFKAVIGEITFNTARNTVSDGGGYDTMSDKFRLLARENVYAGKEVSTVDEGGVYDYYSKYSSHSSASTSADTNRIKRYNNSPNWWWLRSPGAGGAAHARSIHSDGSLNYFDALHGFGVVVTCNVV